MKRRNRWTAGMMAGTILALFLMGCGAGQADQPGRAEVEDSQALGTVQEEAAPQEPEPVMEDAEGAVDAATVLVDGENTLIVYYSWSPAGNTERMATYIQEQTGGDLLELEPQNPYPTDYEACGEVARVERDEDARPEIANLPDSIEGYDTILIGYPIWWHTAPMIIGTFLESYDLTGVDVYPFAQSGSMDTEHFDNSMGFVRENAAGANVHDGLFVEASDTEAILTYLTANGLAASETSVQGSATADDMTGVNAGTSILIAYFSVMETDGVDTVAGASRVSIDGETLGNTEYIARLMQRETGGDLFRIETVQDYPTTHDPLLEFAYNERSDGARPELATQIDDLSAYDVILLGYPNWNSDLPMPLYTFLESYDLGGKTIIPFTTHGGSGFARTIRTIEELQPNATVISDGLSIARNSVAGAENDVVSFIKELGPATE